MKREKKSIFSTWKASICFHKIHKKNNYWLCVAIKKNVFFKKFVIKTCGRMSTTLVTYIISSPTNRAWKRKPAFFPKWRSGGSMSSWLQAIRKPWKRMTAIIWGKICNILLILALYTYTLYIIFKKKLFLSISKLSRCCLLKLFVLLSFGWYLKIKKEWMNK